MGVDRVTLGHPPGVLLVFSDVGASFRLRFVIHSGNWNPMMGEVRRVVTPDRTLSTEPAGDEHPPIDDIDRELVRLLEQDGRISYADLGRAVGLSAAGARLRVLRLQASGAVRIVAVVDPSLWGLHARAYVGLTVSSDVHGVVDEVRRIPGVLSAALVNGRFDVLADVAAVDGAGMLAVLNDQFRTLPGVVRAEALTIYPSPPTPPNPSGRSGGSVEGQVGLPAGQGGGGPPVPAAE
jgi:Lrp/AsnC family transcriptional regulator for asnA, asnC and gidA